MNTGIKLLLAVAGLTCQLLVGVAAAAEQPPIPSLTVSGQATGQIAPDQAEVVFTVEVTSTSVSDGQRVASERATAVLGWLLSQGIAREDISTGRFNVYPQYSPDSNKISGYRLENSLRVTVHNLNRLPSVIDGALQNGCNRIDGLSFSRRDMTDYGDKIMQQAVDDAIRKAQLLARGFGVALGKPLLINEGHVSWRNTIQPDVSLMKLSAAVATPIEPGMIEATAGVTVTFAIN
ncbi:MAG: SIMPL domain-containing protein [Negativicutes bacterium]|nr:SIMPL domain-containing protein [Negativicutes bacterium]